jgi:hypothetical protein
VASGIGEFAPAAPLLREIASYPGGHKGTPLLVADGVLDIARIAEIFRAQSALVPAEYVELVSTRLAELGPAGAVATP